MKTWLTAGLAGVLVLGCGSDNEGTTGPNDKVPPAPSSVSAKIVNDNIVLTWSEVPEATEYRVYMAAEAGVKRSNYTTLLANMYHPDLVDKFDHPPGLNANMKYFLVVTSVNANGESAESCEVGATIATKEEESC
jgi:hypothetical protein